MSRVDDPDAADLDRGRFSDPPDAIRNGVPSWTTVTDPPSGIDTETVTALTEATAAGTVRDALARTFPTGRDGGPSVADELAAREALFVDPADVWRIPVADAIGGRCLDVNAGVGTRSLLLAELAESVDAADTELESLSFLAARDDYAVGDRVTPIHAETAALPKPSNPYETVVADLTGANRPVSLSKTVADLTEHLASDGALLLLLDGWPRLAGLTDAVGFGVPRRAGDGGALSRAFGAAGAGIRGYERLLSSLGFENVDLYGLVPDPSDPSYVVPTDDPGAVRRLFDVGGAGNAVDRLAVRGAGFAQRVGILDGCWPAYLAVCRAGPGSDAESGDFGSGEFDADPLDEREDGDPSTPATRGLVTRGGGRSTVLVDGEDGSLAGVTKVPHRRAHAEFALDECRTMRALREGDGTEPDRSGILGDAESAPVPETIPSGTVTMTRFGPTYSEEPARGVPLSGSLSRDPEDFRRVLERGLDWLARMQLRYGSGPFERSPEAVTEDLRFEEFGLEPPPVDRPIRLFETPCHGDFHPKNVFVERGGTSVDANATGGGTGPVTAVIDWELGSVADNPIVDPAFFVLQTARLAFGGLEEGIDGALASPGPHANAVRDVVDDYCDAVGLSHRAFTTYLPTVWIRRLRRCSERGATASYSGRALRRASDVRTVWDRRSEISAVLDE